MIFCDFFSHLCCGSYVFCDCSYVFVGISILSGCFYVIVVTTMFFRRYLCFFVVTPMFLATYMIVVAVPMFFFVFCSLVVLGVLLHLHFLLPLRLLVTHRFLWLLQFFFGCTFATAASPIVFVEAPMLW